MTSPNIFSFPAKPGHSAFRPFFASQTMRLFETFKAIRWADNNGEAYCPKCGCVAVYQYTARRIFKCQGCDAQFSLTSGTIFGS
jgi:ribosomal protein L37AE/L43A